MEDLADLGFSLCALVREKLIYYPTVTRELIHYQDASAIISNPRDFKIAMVGTIEVRLAS